MLQAATLTPSEITPPPTEKLSRKARRAAAARAAAAASGELSPPSPIGATDSAVSLDSIGLSEDQTDKKNPYIEAINKRLRTLKKRLAKVEKYEQEDSISLNPDQIVAIDRKPEVVAAVKELEDVFKALSVVELEEARAARIEQEAREAAKQVEIARAEQNAKAAADEHLRELIKLLHLWDVPLSCNAPIPHSLSEEQCNAIAYFRAMTTGAGRVINDVESLVENSGTFIKKYLDRSPESVFSAISYAELYDLISNILFPPPPPKFGQEDDLPENHDQDYTTEDPSSAEFEEGADSVTPEVASAGGAQISFFNPSEVLGVEQVITQEVKLSTEITQDDSVVETVTETTTIVTTTELSIPAAGVDAHVNEASALAAHVGGEEEAANVEPAQNGGSAEAVGAQPAVNGTGGARGGRGSRRRRSGTGRGGQGGIPNGQPRGDYRNAQGQHPHARHQGQGQGAHPGANGRPNQPRPQK
ncbi:hypothetical protein HDV00_006803 [Rhizophlyctis rosea]|nr:hypothetical protein HDV00_006803 [Rhizophlyctis rosea]